MKKTPTIFERDWEGDKSKVVNKINPAADWVFRGEGVATQKLDGSCCMIKDGKLFRRFEAKMGRPRPAGFIEIDRDSTTSKIVGWVPVSATDPADKWHRQAFENLETKIDGTYELLGPKVQGNPEKFDRHELVNHEFRTAIYRDCPRTFDGLREWFTGKDIEGIVFHHPDGRMAKIKLRDFGIKRS